MLRFIKLSSHINPRHGYAAEPRFATQVWSLLLRRADEVEALIFANSHWNGGARNFAAGERRTPRIASIGRMESLSDKSFKNLQTWSSEDGHLTVLYAVPHASRLLTELIWLYPFGGKLGDEARDDLGLKHDETTELRDYVASVAGSHVIVSFAAQADPCCIFGGQDKLDAILRRAGEDGTRS